ncbi:MAG: thioredoxin [Bacteroidota bacterium]
MAQSFNEIINRDTPTLVDFYAEWCGPCKMMKPILEELKSKVGTNATILKMDVDKNPQVASAYQIRGLPTLILFQKGKVVWRESGVLPAHELAKIIQNHSN